MFHNLLNGHHVFTLDSDTLVAEVRHKAQISLSNSTHVCIIHDPCDIRKENSTSLEYIGKVQSLKKLPINGYKTFNSTAIDLAQSDVNLLEHKTYSTAHPDFITEETVKLYKKDPETALIDAKTKGKIKKGGYVNTHKLFLETVLDTHNTLKATNKSVVLTHIQDREFDSEEYFEYITDLGDEFITRLKLSRLSNERELVYTPKTINYCTVKKIKV